MLHVPRSLEVIRSLGSGATFEAVLVRTGPGELGVCKRLRSGLELFAAAQHAAEREVEALRRLDGVAAPRLLAEGTDAWGRWWLQGHSAGTRLAEAGNLHPLQTSYPAAAWLKQVVLGALQSLRALHDRGIVHGDLQPEHMVLDSSARIAFIDFGMARHDAMPQAWLQRQERGTLPYVAPEVAAGACCPSPDSDGYALAASLWVYALGATPVLAAHPAARLQCHVEQGFPWQANPLLGAGQELAAVLQQMLRFEPSQRLRDLERACDRISEV